MNSRKWSKGKKEWRNFPVLLGLSKGTAKDIRGIMATLEEIVSYCDQRTQRAEIPDFPGAENGLQVENDGSVAKVGAAVDAGIEPFRKAVAANIDFIIVHHGLYWTPPLPLVGSAYDKMKLLLDNNLALYGSHLPLDRHPEIGNNAILASKLELSPCGTFLPHECVDIGLLAESSHSRDDLRSKLENLFPQGITSMEYGSEKPERIAILTGSGQSAVDKILDAGSDTLVAGELRQHHFNLAQELRLNLYACGHYATETFGVDALAREVSEKFDLPYEFIETPCPL